MGITRNLLGDYRRHDDRTPEARAEAVARGVTEEHVNIENGIILPSWFLKAFAGFAALAVPWAAWVTMTLHGLSILAVESTKHDNNGEVRAHLANSDVHAGGNALLNLRYMEILRRVEILEMKLPVK